MESHSKKIVADLMFLLIVEELKRVDEEEKRGKCHY
jgi:hypothetical protein